VPKGTFNQRILKQYLTRREQARGVVYDADRRAMERNMLTTKVEHQSHGKVLLSHRLAETCHYCLGHRAFEGEGGEI